MLRLHRIFCATPWELEAERIRFYDLIGTFNETAAMPKGIVYVPVTLLNVRDKRPMQYIVDENIRACRHYLLLLGEDWGPVERNFRHDYQLALQCEADPALPMEGVAILAKRELHEIPPGHGLPEPKAAFSTLAEFDGCVYGLLSGWLESLLSASAASA